MLMPPPPPIIAHLAAQAATLAQRNHKTNVEVDSFGRAWTDTGRFNPVIRPIEIVEEGDPDYVPAPAMDERRRRMLINLQASGSIFYPVPINDHTNQEGKQVAQPVKESACAVSLPSSSSSSPWWRRAWDKLSSRLTRPVH